MLNTFDVNATAAPFLGLLYIFAMAILHISFAIGVYGVSLKGKTQIVSGFTWATATLLLGPFFAAVYWLVHHSSLGGFNTESNDKYRRKLEEVRAERKAKDLS